MTETNNKTCADLFLRGGAFTEGNRTWVVTDGKNPELKLFFSYDAALKWLESQGKTWFDET